MFVSDNPGLIASAGLRIKIWTILLLGNSQIREDVGLINSYEVCGEMNVLEADVRRTRSSIEIFKLIFRFFFFSFLFHRIFISIPFLDQQVGEED